MATPGLSTPPAPSPVAPAQADATLSRAPGGDPAALLALADRCVQCGLCLPHCPTYRLDASEAESPRGRIAYVRALAAGALAPTPTGDLHLDHCLGCLRCQGACPAGVDYASLLVGARAAQFQREPGPRRSHGLRWLLRSALLPTLLAAYRLAFAALPRRWRVLPRPPSAAAVTSPPTAASMDVAPVAVFRGCISSTYETDSRAALSRLMAATGMPIVEPPAQACCGAADRHAGDVASADALDAANRRAFAQAGRVLCLASGCRASLADALRQVAPVEDALVALEARAEGLRFRDAGGLTVALHLPCTQWSSPGSVGATRRLLARVPGLRVVELPDTGCCGAAGVHMLAFPARAAALRDPLLAAFAHSGAGQLLSANIGCRLHLANALGVPVRHPVDLLGEWLVDEAIHPSTGPTP